MKIHARSLARLTALLSAALLLFACSTTDKNCTLIGCNDGLTIAFKTQPPADFSLTLKAAGQADKTLACPGGAASHVCFPDSSVFVNDYTPTSVEVSYRAGDKTVTKSFTPSYTNAQPNGVGCGPDCKQARVELEI